MNKLVRPLLVVLFLIVIGYGTFRLWDVNNNYEQEQRVREQMDFYKPPPPDIPNLTNEHADRDIVVVNQSIVDAKMINPDIVGWLTLENTNIDYPFVQAPDNDYYLRRDIYEKHAYAGTVFMDYRCAADFTDFVTVLYGHNMKNGSMFADIRNYADAEFFETNDSGVLYLENATFKIEIFAYLTVRGDDALVYAVGATDELFYGRDYLTYIRQNAVRYRELELSVSDRYVVLSTCTGTSKELRRVLIARLSKI